MNKILIKKIVEDSCRLDETFKKDRKLLVKQLKEVKESYINLSEEDRKLVNEMLLNESLKNMLKKYLVGFSLLVQLLNISPTKASNFHNTLADASPEKIEAVKKRIENSDVSDIKKQQMINYIDNVDTLKKDTISPIDSIPAKKFSKETIKAGSSYPKNQNLSGYERAYENFKSFKKGGKVPNNVFKTLINGKEYVYYEEPSTKLDYMIATVDLNGEIKMHNKKIKDNKKTLEPDKRFKFAGYLRPIIKKGETKPLAVSFYDNQLSENRRSYMFKRSETDYVIFSSSDALTHTYDSDNYKEISIEEFMKGNVANNTLTIIPASRLGEIIGEKNERALDKRMKIYTTKSAKEVINIIKTKIEL